MHMLYLAAYTTVYNKTTKVVMFHLIYQKKKQFNQILVLPSSGTLYEVTNEQVIHMFNKMDNQPTLSVIIQFKKSSLPSIWSFLFGIFLRCLIGRNFGLDKAKLDVYSIMVGLYYGVVANYESLLWEDFGNSISHSKLESGVFES